MTRNEQTKDPRGYAGCERYLACEVRQPAMGGWYLVNGWGTWGLTRHATREDAERRLGTYIEVDGTERAPKPQPCCGANPEVEGHAPDCPKGVKPSIESIKAANRAAGGHWFDSDTLAFFRSRVSARVYVGPGGVYFVTSEQHTMSWRNYQGPRLYTVRRAIDGGARIETAGEFQGYETARAAHAVADRLAAGTVVVHVQAVR